MNAQRFLTRLTWALALSLIALQRPGFAQNKPAASADSVSGGAQTAQKPVAPVIEEDPRFDVLEYIVNGNTVLPRLMIERAVYPHLGERRTIKDVERARENLERAYHDAGYSSVVVDIPEQKIDTRIVRLQVTEGRIDRLKVTGSRYYALGEIRSTVTALAPGEVPYFPQAQEQLAQLSRTPDRRVTPVLRPGSAPGAMEVDLKVEDRLPLHGSIELNDRRSADTEPLRLSGSLRYENLWQRGHTLSASYQTSPQDTSQVRALFVSYSLTLPASDKVLALYAVRSRSSVSSVGGANVLGDGTIFGARTIWPLPAGGTFFHSLTLGVDFKDFREGTTLAGADTVKTPISYIPFLIGYNATTQDESGITQVGATFNFAMRGLGDNRIDCFGQVISEFACKRFNARSNYAYVRAEASRAQTLSRGFTLFGKIEGQLAKQALISNEQFSAGGADSVRGYYESAITGDDGWRGSLELRSPSLLPGDAKDAWGNLTAVAFVEGASLRVVDPLPAQTSKFNISSTGFGLRLKSRGFAATLDVAWPLRDVNRTQSGKARAGFRLSYEF